MHQIGQRVVWTDNGNTRSGIVKRHEHVEQNSGDVVDCLVVFVPGDLSARAWRLIRNDEATSVDKK